MAATSVAERVAEEMAEPALGQTVGYQIRLEAKRSTKTRLLFCTTGVIMRRLQDDPTLKGISHICVDEVGTPRLKAQTGTASDLKPLLLANRFMNANIKLIAFW